LPEIEDYAPDGSGKSPLARCESFVNTSCPSCGGRATRETDVSDNFLDSAWYFFRYPSVNIHNAVFDPNLTKKWLPVDMYIGGNEHAVLHLMYTRFLTMAFKEIGLIDFEEPFKKFKAHGLLIKDGTKMSKSKGNVVNPDEHFDKYGADTFRMYLMFLGPFQEGGDFRDEGIIGVRKYLERVWRWILETETAEASCSDTEALGILHRGIKKITNDLENLRYNTAVAALMEMLNALTAANITNRDVKEIYLRCLAPICPYIVEELWERLGNATLIMNSGWPEYQERYCAMTEVEFVVQVNGKVRARMAVPAGLEEDKAFDRVMELDRVKEFLKGKVLIKKIFVRDKLMNLVVR